MRAALPEYVTGTESSAPGHRFALYCPVWNPRDWSKVKTQDTDVLKKIIGFHSNDTKLMNSLIVRQKNSAQSLKDTLHTVYSKSVSPLVTGMGYEHPLENGFAFLNPYGLPYLPGSSIKGVLRRAAEELAEDGQIQDEDTSLLFGSDDVDNPSQGALNFWDVFPQVNQNTLHIEVMTPHYGDYYEGSVPPHDSGQPVPVVFLTIPPESQFCFHVQKIRKLPESYLWKSLLEQIFKQAFDWLGFGAKTAIGYGYLEKDEEKEKQEKEVAAEARKTVADNLCEKIKILADWGAVQSFAKQGLKELDAKDYTSDLGQTLKQHVEQLPLSKQKLKKNPNLKAERLAEVEGWLKRF